MRQIRAVLGLVALTVLVAGCGQASASPASQVDAAAVAEALATSAPYQADVLADGVVSYPEYESAQFAVVTCMRDAGITVQDPHAMPDDDRKLTWSYEVIGGPGVELDSPEFAALQANADEAYTRCSADYFDAIGLVYESQLLLDPTERDAIRPALVECLNADGAGLAADAADTAIFEATSRLTTDEEPVHPCMVEFRSYFTTSVVNPDGAHAHDDHE